MANLQSTIDLIFNGVDLASDVADKLSGNISKKFGAIGQAGGQLEMLAAPLANIADRILQTESALTALGATMVGVGVNEAGKFNDSFNFTRTLFDATSEQFGQFRQDILSYAQGSTQSIEQINQALQSAIGQGVDYKDSLGLLREAERLSVAQGAALKDTTELMAGAMNAYGLEVGQASKMSDIFSITVRDGKISIEQLNALMANVTPLAAAAGVGLEQVGAAIAVLTSQGFKAEQSVTGVKNIIEGVIKPTDQAAKFAESLGLQFNATALQSKGLQGVLIDVQKATGGNVEKMAQLFTTSEGLTAALALSGKGAGAFAKELEAMRTETGVTNAAFEKMAANIDLGAQKMKNAITVALINLGDPLLDEFGRISGALSTVFSRVGDQFKDGGALRPITAALEQMGGQLGNTIDRIATNLPAAFEKIDVSRLIDAYRDLGTELAGTFQAFFGDIDLTTVDGLAAAVQKVVDSIEFLTRSSAGIVGAFRPAVDAAGEVVNQFNKMDEASKVDFGKFLGAARLIVSAGAEIGTALLVIGQTTADLAPIFDQVFGGVRVGVNALQVTFDAVSLGVLNIQKTLLEAGLAVAEFGQKFAFTDAAAQENQQAIEGFKSRLTSLQPVMDGVAANLERNKREMNEGWAQATGSMGSNAESLTARLDGMRERLSTLKTSTLESKDALMDWSDGMRQGGAAAEAARAGIMQANSQMMDWSNGLAEGTKRLIQWKGEASNFPELPLPDGVKVSLAYQEAGKGVGIYGTAIEGVSTKYEQVGTKTVKATDAFKAVSTAAEDNAKKMEEATKKSNEFLIKMEEIASNERIRTIEASVSLKTAQLETDAERVKALFASIDNTISNTGDLLGSLFGQLNNADTYTKLDIKEQIDLENKRRQDALDIQRKLAEAEIDRVRAQTRALDRGDALIRIDTTGLDPAFEMLLKAFVGKIRMYLNKNMQDFLLLTT